MGSRILRNSIKASDAKPAIANLPCNISTRLKRVKVMMDNSLTIKEETP